MEGSFMFIDTQPNKTFITFSRPMSCISSAIFGGGFKNNVLTVANLTIPTDLNVPVELMSDYCRKTLDLTNHQISTAVVLLTAVPQKYLGHSSCHRCFVTAGLSNARPLVPKEVWDERNERFVSYSTGTINCIICLNDHLSQAALIEGYGIAKITIAEVVRHWCALNDKPLCVGTQTDCTALLCPQTGQPLNFAGLGTKIGAEISVMVREATINAISHKYPNYKG